MHNSAVGYKVQLHAPAAQTLLQVGLVRAKLFCRGNCMRHSTGPRQIEVQYAKCYHALIQAAILWANLVDCRQMSSTPVRVDFSQNGGSGNAGMPTSHLQTLDLQQGGSAILIPRSREISSTQGTAYFASLLRVIEGSAMKIDYNISCQIAICLMSIKSSVATDATSLVPCIRCSCGMLLRPVLTQKHVFQA